MGRRSSGGGFRSSPAPRRAPPNPAAKSSSTPPPAPKAQPNGNGSVMGNLGSAIADGIGWGAGSSIAHRAVDAIMGPRTIKVEEVTLPAGVSVPASGDVCHVNAKAFTECLSSNRSEISKCLLYMDMLSECQRNSGGSMSHQNQGFFF